MAQRQNIYGRIRTVLCNGGMDGGEARAVALLLLEKACGLTVAEALTAEAETAVENAESVMEMARRVSSGEPVQYVLGEADFCGMSLHVRPGVLIPRPETEELVDWVTEDGIAEEGSETRGRVLDICTGSGCVAVALARRFPSAEVEAWDVSEEALEVARMNAERCGAEVTLRNVDVLNRECATRAMGNGWDVIVSNPPYVCEEEAADMETHVLEHEPRLALFVPDEDPLRFYRLIAQEAQEALRKGGRLYFEINRRFGREVVSMLEGMGYEDVELRQDFCGNDRMVKAIKRHADSLL